ncbi:O-antigen ligase family protein [Novosphingobium flavum]|uniref:O-antigen ligase family protein n=1 Tax=Novosphingobium flavum TaxID=1778672 RepID=A0A7X1FPB1_9SPHN|nr:O-antigen ligase family protein [Novosphingobium flavum]MBC2664458.1 O-antigen ligase family protein [Novosphingobium flavum]
MQGRLIEDESIQMTELGQRAARRRNLVAMVLVGGGMVLGGGGSPSPLPELALQLLACALLASWALCARGAVFPAARPAWTIVAILLGLPLIQLIPLPPLLWHALPGRETERAALALVGAEDAWKPWSLVPARTLASLLALAVPAALVLMVTSLDRFGRAMAIGMIAAVGALALLVGVAQMAGGDANAWRFYVPDGAYVNGFQANHNSAADVLLIAMVAFAATVRELEARRPERRNPAVALGFVSGGTVLFSLGVFFTASRAGTMLLPVAWLGVAFIARTWIRPDRRTIQRLAVLAGGGLVVLAILVMTSGMAARVMHRYDFGGEFRPQLWRDALFAVGQYFPFGSGMGTFVPVFVAAERLEAVDATMPNRAHNDFLEFLIEGGVFAAIALSSILAILTRRLIQRWREARTGGGHAQVVFAAAAWAIIGLHSLVDYPLRSMALACIAAVAISTLMPLVNSRGDNPNA